MDYQSLETWEFWGNSGVTWFWAAVTFIGLMIIFKVVAQIIISRLRKLSKKTETNLDDFIIGLIRNVWPPFYYFVALFIAVQLVELNQVVNDIVFGLFMIVVVLQAIFTSQRIIDFFVKNKFLQGDEEEIQEREGIIKFTRQIIKGSLWVLGVLMVLGNLGIDVTSLIAGLGIGGIAIALAVKDILGDIFASVSILIDKPFKVGDFVGISPKEQGTVQKIGIKTTRLKTREGHQLIIANRLLTDSVIQNFKRKGKRQIIFMLGVTYETSKEKLRAIPKIVTQIIEEHENAQPERVIFKQFGPSSLDFEVVYTVKSSEKLQYLKVKDQINFAILEKFNQEGIDFAYPTQTLFVNKE